MLQYRTEDDDIPLGQFLYNHNAKFMQYQQQKMMQQYYFQYLNPQPIAIVPHYRRPSYPVMHASLLDTSSDEEDDEDLVPIAVLQNSQKLQLQSAAEKYKEKVKAQLL